MGACAVGVKVGVWSKGGWRVCMCIMREWVYERAVVSYKRPPNLRSLLVHTKPDRGPAIIQPRPGPPGTHPCGHPRCKTCQTVLARTAVDLSDTQHFGIKDSFTCKSSSVIYFISRTACNAAYVGETGCRLHERMNGHRHSIKNNEDTPVAIHFSTEGHTLRVAVLQRTPQDVIKRRTLEKLWIARFKASPRFRTLNRDDGIDILLLPHIHTLATQPTTH